MKTNRVEPRAIPVPVWSVFMQYRSEKHSIWSAFFRYKKFSQSDRLYKKKGYTKGTEKKIFLLSDRVSYPRNCMKNCINNNVEERE